MSGEAFLTRFTPYNLLLATNYPGLNALCAYHQNERQSATTPLEDTFS